MPSQFCHSLTSALPVLTLSHICPLFCPSHVCPSITSAPPPLHLLLSHIYPSLTSATPASISRLPLSHMSCLTSAHRSHLHLLHFCSSLLSAPTSAPLMSAPLMSAPLMSAPLMSAPLMSAPLMFAPLMSAPLSNLHIAHICPCFTSTPLSPIYHYLASAPSLTSLSPYSAPFSHLPPYPFSPSPHL